MTEDYRPFRGIHGIDDLLLARKSAAAGDTVPVSEPYYGEICAWVTLDAPAETLFGEKRPVLACDAWRLLLTEHGYLRFESDTPDAPEAESYLPAHVAVGKGGMRLGLAISNSAWLLRETDYARETERVSAVRLLAGPADGPLSRIGEETGWLAPDLRPVPGELRVGLGPGGLTAYNALDADAIALQGGDPADDLLPLIPGGSSFEPRWIDERTVEVFGRPEFIRSSSYWVLLRPEDTEPAPDRLIVRTIHWGGANMTPTFFVSPDRQQWRRVAPKRVTMGPDGTHYSAEFAWSDVAGHYLASAPLFGDSERRALIARAELLPEVHVQQIGASVEGRAIHAIRVGEGPRGAAIICGQHSPLEIMGGRMIAPMIDALRDRPELLEAASFIFVPTANVDCAHYGGTGLNVNQRNNNRHWIVNVQPENRAVIEHINALRDDGLRFELGIDVHAGGVFRNPVLMHMGNGQVEVAPHALEAQETWRDLLEQHAGLRRADGRPLGQDHLRATDWLHQEHGAVAFCLELSTCSWFDPRAGRTRPFSVDALDVIAEGIVTACADYFTT